jgi:DNA-binding GntR family transcriptional regulator
MNALSQIRAINLREQVADEIRTAIIEGRLKPNDRVTESVLTRQLGVSRTPVREALIILEQESLIVSVPNRGSYVRAFDEADIEALFSMRTTLENFAAELIIDRLTDEDYATLQGLIDQQKSSIHDRNYKQVRSTDMTFHKTLIERTEHPTVIRNWTQIVAQVAAVLYVRADAQPDYDEYRAIEDHFAILNAYRAHDLEQVKRENRRINTRVAAECRSAVRLLGDQADISDSSTSRSEALTHP